MKQRLASEPQLRQLVSTQYVYLELKTNDPEFRQWTQMVPPTGNGIPMVYIVSSQGQTIYNKSGAPQGDGLQQLLLTGIQQTGGFKNPVADTAANEKQLAGILKRSKGLLGRDLTQEAIAAIAPLVEAQAKQDENAAGGAASSAAPSRSSLQQEFDALIEQLTQAGQAELDSAKQLAASGKGLVAAVSLMRVQRIYGELPTLTAQLASTVTEFNAADPENEAYMEQAQAIDRARQFEEKRSLRAAVAAYGKVVDQYPGTLAAELAATRIDQLAGSKPAESTAGTLQATRTWRDTTGQFSVVAKLVSFDGKSVELKKTNGSTIRVPLEKLDRESQSFLEQQNE